MDITISRASERHILALGELWMEFMRYSQSVEDIHEPEDDAIPIYISDYLRPCMEAEGSLVLTALDGDKAVGYSYSYIVPRSNLVKRERFGLIHDMFVTAGYRRMGIATKLYDENIRWLRSNAVDRVELDIMTRNQMAVSFWEKLGFADLNRTLFRQI